jgi:hypothetical protein
VLTLEIVGEFLGLPPLSGEATFGKDFVLRRTFYGFRLHVHPCWPGLISPVVLAPASVH